MKNNGCPPLEIYVHIPFCARKCAYCDFLSFPAGEDVQQAYTKALIKEIQALPKEERPVSSVFAGGGTPSLVREDFIEEILDHLRKTYTFSPDAEITLEANPGL